MPAVGVILIPPLYASQCDEVQAALEGLPNNAVPIGTTYCSKFNIFNRTVQSITGTASGWNNNKFSNSFPDAKYTKSYAGVSPHPRYNIIQFVATEQFSALAQGEIFPEMDLTSFASSYDNVTGALSGNYYEIIFSGNPGYLPEPKIELYLDGKRPSLTSKNGKVITKVWTDGAQGEDDDYFADHCDGVTVHIARNGYRGSYLTSLSAAEKKLLMACLGDSDFDPQNNVEVYNWDYGSKLYPHIIKLVKTVTSSTDGGVYAVVYYTTAVSLDDSGISGTFLLVNHLYSVDQIDTDNYDVYTTQGTLALTSNFSEAQFGKGLGISRPSLLIQ